jgi:hypothetical protein
MSTTGTTQTFYKMDIQGIVYLVDPATTIAYTYDPDAPTAIGKVKWVDAATAPELILYDNWREILEAKCSATAEKVSAVTTATA